MTPAERIRFRSVHQRAHDTAASLSWCCEGHREQVQEVLLDQLQVFVSLGPRDHDGYRECMEDAEAFLEHLETLAVLWHPGINVPTRGAA